MLALAAVVLFAIAAFVAFTPAGGVSVIGLIAVGLACLAAHSGWGWWQSR